MITAITEGRRAFATPGARGLCVGCQAIVIAKCGEIVTHHWAHQPGSECAYALATALESEWHAGWKLECSDPTRVEVTRGNHRADAVSPSGLVLEFQHSGIEPADVRAREQHWRRGVWIADGVEHYADARLETFTHPDRITDPYRNFIWRWSPHLINTAKWPVWIDLDPDSDMMMFVGKLYTDSSPRRGYGWQVSRQTFIDGMLNGYGITPRRPPFGMPWNPQPVTEPADQAAIPAQVTPGGDDPTGPTFDWHEHRVGDPRQCRICGHPAMLRDEHGRPCHKVCAEEQAVAT